MEAFAFHSGGRLVGCGFRGTGGSCSFVPAHGWLSSSSLLQPMRFDFVLVRWGTLELEEVVGVLLADELEDEAHTRMTRAAIKNAMVHFHFSEGLDRLRPSSSTDSEKHRSLHSYHLGGHNYRFP